MIIKRPRRSFCFACGVRFFLLGWLARFALVLLHPLRWPGVSSRVHCHTFQHPF